jgi:hypothetical protein
MGSLDGSARSRRIIRVSPKQLPVSATHPLSTITDVQTLSPKYSTGEPHRAPL